MTVILAMALDAVLGEPKWLWSRIAHPAVLMGRLIGWADQKMNTGSNTQRRWKGVFLVVGLLVLSVVLGRLIAQLGPVAVVFVGAVLLAHRSLVQHVLAVADALRTSEPAGRVAVSMIVGRDTSGMSSSDICRAAIESAAENFSDGVVAPLFWFCLLGPTGLIFYKCVNTADSMIGYRNARYEHFGKAAARTDDALNWIPARLTAVLIQLSYGQRPSLAQLRPDARLHRSPNAGWPEAAMARILSVALSGPRSYDGVLRDLPWVNGAARRRLWPADIRAAVQVLWRSWWCMFGLVFALGAIALLI